MDILGIILILAGFMLSFFYGLVLIITAFKTSIWWGLGYLFVPFAAFAFWIIHWDVAKRPFLMSFLALPLIIGGAFLSPALFS